MGALQSFFGKIMTDDVFTDLSEDQSLAVLECLLLIGTADGQVSGAEQESIHGELMALPWSWKTSGDVAAQVIASTYERIAKLADQDDAGIRRHLADTARRIPAGPAREKAVRMMVAVACADGVDDMERAVFGTIVEAMDLDQAWVQQIVAEVKRELGAN